MAKREITMACGHAEVHNIGGPVKGRDRKAEWIADNRVCAECYKAEQDAKRKANNVAAATAAKAEGRPELVGSDKQVAWAETIREGVWVMLAEVHELVSAQMPEGDEAGAKIIGVVERMQAETDAATWINNRDMIRNLAIFGKSSTKAAATIIYREF